MDSCDTYGVCGGNGFCNVDGFPTCGCLEKFLPNNNASENLSSLGCHRRKPLSCLQDGSSFQIYSGIKLPDTNNSWNKKTEQRLEEELQLPMFDWSTMLRATNNLSNKIGQGGFGVVYKGVLDGRWGRRNSCEEVIKEFCTRTTGI
nr:G-type lectin S-receptor-like serine/threonine-protein kinase At4g27290 [Ipomoea batatas]